MSNARNDFENYYKLIKDVNEGKAPDEITHGHEDFEAYQYLIARDLVFFKSKIWSPGTDKERAVLKDPESTLKGLQFDLEYRANLWPSRLNHILIGVLVGVVTSVIGFFMARLLYNLFLYGEFRPPSL